MEIDRFLGAIEHNANMTKEQLQTGRFCAQDYYFLRNVTGELILEEPNSHRLSVSRKFDDLSAASIVGALPFINQHGADALLVNDDGSFNLVELKQSMVSHTRFKCGPKGGIYVGDSRNNRVSLRSNLGASYNICNNLGKKNMETYHVLIDEELREVVCVHIMNGEAVLDCLTTNQSNGKVKTGKSREIKLGTFASQGVEITPAKFRTIGLVNWENFILERWRLITEIQNLLNEQKNFPSGSSCFNRIQKMIDSKNRELSRICDVIKNCY